MLKPTVGMQTLLKVAAEACETAGQPYYAAIVAKVNDDGSANLAVFDQDGSASGLPGAVLVQATEDAPAHFEVPVTGEPEGGHSRRRHRKADVEE